MSKIEEPLEKGWLGIVAKDVQNAGWISVKKELPKPGQKVLIYWYEAPNTETFDDCIFTARYERSDGRTKGYFETTEFDDAYYPYPLRPGVEVKYWQPLPAPPKI